MTIAAGFRCRDGIIVCADREITTGTGKLWKKKIWTADYKKLSVVVTGAGSFSHLESAATKIIEKLKSSSFDESPEIIRSVFEYVCKREYFQKPGCPSPGTVPFDLIVGLSSPQRMQIIRMEQGVLKRNCGAELVGSGAPWAQYFFDMYHHYPRLSDGIVLGAYVVYVVKKSGLGCGGPTDLYVVKVGEEPEHLGVSYLDDIFGSLRVPFRDLVFAASDLNLSDAEFDQELGRVVRLLKSYRSGHKKRWQRAISRMVYEIDSNER